MALISNLGWSNGVRAQFAMKATGGSMGIFSHSSGRKTVSMSIPMYSLSLGHRIL